MKEQIGPNDMLRLYSDVLVLVRDSRSRRVVFLRKACQLAIIKLVLNVIMSQGNIDGVL